jgi:hypothetical protein
MGYGKWKVRFNDGSVEELSSRMLKKIRFIGESDYDDNGNHNETTGVDNGHDNSYDYNWDNNGNTGVNDNSEDSGLELEPTRVDDSSEPDDEFNEFIGEEDVLDDTLPGVDGEAPPTEDKYACKLRKRNLSVKASQFLSM